MTIDDIDRELEERYEKINQLKTEVVANENLDPGVWWSTTEAMTISVVVLIFGFLIILLATYLIKIGRSAEAVLRIFGTILIVMVSVFLVVAGYDSNQISPVMGLLGTIAGYLLGKEPKDK